MGVKNRNEEVIHSNICLRNNKSQEAGHVWGMIFNTLSSPNRGSWSSDFFFPAIYPAGLFFHKVDWVRGGVSPLKTTVSLKAQEQVFMKTGEGEHGFPSVLVPSTQQEKVLEQQHCPTAPSALLQRNVYIYAAQYGSH